MAEDGKTAASPAMENVAVVLGLALPQDLQVGVAELEHPTQPGEVFRRLDVGNDCEFAYNDCHHVNLVTTDSGIIEAATALDWGLSVEKQRERHRPHNWGNTVHHNLLHDSGGWLTAPSGQLEFPAFTWAIYLDLDCCGWHVHDNVCYNTVLGGFMLNGGTDNVVENNVFADGKQHQIHWNPWPGYVMRDNRCRQNIFAYAGRPANLYALNGFRDEFVAFRNNLVHAGNGQIGIQGVRDLPRKGTWEAWQRRGQDQGGLLADPRFVDAVCLSNGLAPSRSRDGLGRAREPALPAAHGAETPGSPAAIELSRQAVPQDRAPMSCRSDGAGRLGHGSSRPARSGRPAPRCRPLREPGRQRGLEGGIDGEVLAPPGSFPQSGNAERTRAFKTGGRIRRSPRRLAASVVARCFRVYTCHGMATISSNHR